MFCDGCGMAVQAGQGFCSKCGKQIVGPVAVMRSVGGRVQHHSHLLGILWMAISAFNAIGGFVLVIVGVTLFPHLRELGKVPPDVPIEFLSSIVTVIGILLLGKAAFGFFTGWGLMQHDRWARVLALVLAFVSLFNIPFGTAIGVYTLWVLLPAESQSEYDSLAAAKAA